MRSEELRYPSADGTSKVHAMLWLPDDADATGPSTTLRGVVQLAHGMSEHIGRYTGFAQALTDAGLAVCANDHIGHGLTASGPDDLGHIPLHGGIDMLLSDMRTLQTRTVEMLARAGYTNVPYVLFGHSLGSFMARVYLTRYPEGLSGVVICGTGQQPRLLTDAGRVLTRFIAAVRGERYRSHLIDALGVGAYARAVRGAATRNDWLSTDPAVVQAYLDDPLCGQVFTVGGYAAVSALAGDAQRRDLLASVPRELPLLVIAGAEDPVGDCGAGVRRAVAQYRDAGFSDVEEHIYSSMRHEILNEPGRAAVYADVLDWLDRHL